MGLSLTLGLTPLAAEDEEIKTQAWSLYCNGVRHGVNGTRVGGQDWFDAIQMAAGLGFRLQAGAQGWFVNGQPMQQPVITIAGVPYTTPEAMARTVGAVVQKDPVRTSLMFQVANSNPAGIPYYSADYISPAEERRRQRRADLAMSPGEVMLEEFDEKMAAEWNKKHPWNPYVPRASDYTEINFDNKEMPRILTQEELEKSVTYNAKPQVEHRPSGYLTRSANNGVFQIILKDAKIAEALKGMTPPLMPQPGYKFVVLNLTLENVSKTNQHPGWFNVRDQNGTPYPASTIYSQFGQGNMRSRETTTGYLIFEVPMASQPIALELTVTPALSLSLIYR